MQFPLEDQPRRDSSLRTKHERHNIRAGDAATIGRATLIYMAGMILGKLTGFVRELLIVPKFGYGLYSDAYINAFQIPDLIYELLIGGVVAAVLTPTLSSGIERRQEEKAWHSVSIFMSAAILAMVACLLLAELLAPALMGLITGSAGPDASENLKEMTAMAIPVTRILFIQSFFMMLIALAHGVLSAYKRFTPMALGPSLYNLCYMAVLLAFGVPSEKGLRTVALGVVGSALIYFLYQLLACRHEWHWFSWNTDFQDPGFRRLLRLAIPTLLSGSVLHLSAIIMNRFANGLNIPGAVTGIRQCITSWSLPYAIFAVSIGNVMLPNLAGFYAQKDARKVRSLYSSSLRRALFYVLPFALSFGLLNFETIQAIFQWNAETYSNAQVALTASALRWFCVTMLAQTVVFLTNQAFYARKITRLALFTGLLSLILIPIFCWIFTGPLGLGLEGIGLAHACYSVVTAFMLYQLYKRHRYEYHPARILPFMLRLSFCAVAAALVLLGLKQIPLYPGRKLLQLIWYACKMGLGVFTYYVAGLSLQLREAVRLQVRLRRFFRLPPVEELERIVR